MVSHHKCKSCRTETALAEPVLILTPTGRDASVVMACLHEAGMRTRVCHGMADFCAALDGAAAALIAEEALPAQASGLLLSALKRQPIWSDCRCLIKPFNARKIRQVIQQVLAAPEPL